MTPAQTYLEALEAQRQARALRGNMWSLVRTFALFPMAWAIVYIAFL